jgi:hypothetical protein
MVDIEEIKLKTSEQYLKIIDVLGDNADFIDRFPLELSPILGDLDKKTDDSIYTGKVLNIYKSMAMEANKNALKMFELFEEMKELQMKINPQNFDWE